MSTPVDPYLALGVSRYATDEQIKRNYHKLAYSHHPDHHMGDKDSEEKFKAINDAYELLKDPAKRATYDMSTQPSFGMKSRAEAGEEYRSTAVRQASILETIEDLLDGLLPETALSAMNYLAILVMGVLFHLMFEHSYNIILALQLPDDYYTPMRTGWALMVFRLLFFLQWMCTFYSFKYVIYVSFFGMMVMLWNKHKHIAGWWLLVLQALIIAAMVLDKFIMPEFVYYYDALFSVQPLKRV